jgi:MFS family permease
MRRGSVMLSGVDAVGELKRGWRILLVCMIGVGFGATGLPFYTLGLFLKPQAAEFGWSAGAAAGAALCLQAGLIVTAPLIGRLVDRFGARRVALISLCGLGLGFGVLTLVGSVTTLYAAWLLLALLACGTTPVVWTRTVNAWFDRSRGLALGLTLAGTGVAAILGPILIGRVVAEHGWRAGYWTMAAAVVIGALPLVAALLREAPPRPSAALAAAATTPAASTGHARAALRTRVFWQSAIGFILAGGAIAALIVHLVPSMVDGGIPPAQAAGLAGLMGASIIVGRIAVGLLVDRFHAPFVGFAFLLLPVAGVALQLQGHPALAALAIGLAAGAEVDLLAYLTVRYFGMSAYGEIYGWQLAAFSLGAGLGPLLLGVARDHWGAYAPGQIACAVVIVAGAAMIAGLGRFPAAAGR